MKRIAIIGGGSWGTALGIVAGRTGHQVGLWSRNSDVVESINLRHENEIYLASHQIPESVVATRELTEALHGAELVVLASPSHATRELLGRMLSDLRPAMIFVSASKGIENDTG